MRLGPEPLTNGKGGPAPSSRPTRHDYPSSNISLIADIATAGNRNLVTGRWRGEGSNRRRQPGALDTLQAARLLSIQTTDSGRGARYTFHVLREPPLLAPDQLGQLPPRLQQLHADLLARCNIDQEAYQERIRTFRSLAAQGTTPAAPDSTNNYNEELLIEEVWIRIKEALKLHINHSNYECYVEDTHAITFDRTSGTLTVQASDYMVADHLNRYFTRSLRWALADTRPSIGGVRIYAVHFVPAPQRPWEAAAHD